MWKTSTKCWVDAGCLGLLGLTDLVGFTRHWWMEPRGLSNPSEGILLQTRKGAENRAFSSFFLGWATETLNSHIFYSFLFVLSVTYKYRSQICRGWELRGMKQAPPCKSVYCTQGCQVRCFAMLVLVRYRT